MNLYLLWHTRRIGVSETAVQTPTSSHGLIERFRAGDQQAFADLYTRYEKRLAVLIHFRMSDALRGRYEVADLLQEVFLRASVDVAKFEYRTPGSFFRWLAQIAHHVIADAARHDKRGKRDGGYDPLPARHEPVNLLTPSRILREQEQFDHLISRLDSLPADYRAVIVLAKFEGLTTPAIAEQMGKSREQVALLLHRALKRYREIA